jgi:hypothetical protein
MRQLAIARDYTSLIDALRARIVALDTTTIAIDELAGLPTGYTSKLMAHMPMRSLGRVSLGPLLGALGLKLAVLEDSGAIATTKRLATRKAGALQSAAVEFRVSRRFLQRIARQGGLRSRAKMTRRRATQLARHANRVRWSRVRENARTSAPAALARQGVLRPR